MALVIRLTKVGKRGEAKYRVVVAERRSRRDGKPVESLGWYEKRVTNEVKNVDKKRYDHWIEKGARPSERVAKIMSI